MRYSVRLSLNVNGPGRQTCDTSVTEASMPLSFLTASSANRYVPLLCIRNWSANMRLTCDYATDLRICSRHCPCDYAQGAYLEHVVVLLLLTMRADSLWVE